MGALMTVSILSLFFGHNLRFKLDYMPRFYYNVISFRPLTEKKPLKISLSVTFMRLL